MKKILKIIGVLLLLVIAFVLIAGLFVPKKYHLEKDVTINAPRDKVWTHVRSLQEMEKWSPFAAKDPNIRVTHEGAEGAVGSTYKWDGNKEVGQGEQTITATKAPEMIDTHLHFIRPMDGKADAFIRLNEAGAATKVTWGFDMTYPYPMNVMQLFFDMDDMMGKEYNAGLAKLKTLAEQ